MMKTDSKNKYSQQGLTLLELMISLSVGLMLFAGVMSIFVGMRTTTAETSSYGELQENGRFAISVLTDDLRKQNFWGDYTGAFGGTAINVAAGLVVGNECTGGGLNNGTLPNGVGPFRTLWGQTVTVNDPMTCINDDAKIGSDIIQLKRAVSSPIQIPGVLPVTPVATTTTNNLFLVSNMTTGSIFPQGLVPIINNSQVWEYQHHVYYVRDEQISGSTDTIPVLMQGQLTNRMTFAPIIDGIDMIRVMYGVDMDTDPNLAGYGVVDAYISADNMNDPLWNNAGGTRIIAVKLYVLARSIRPDFKYTNTSTYQLGDLAVPVNDNFRRLLFTSTVTLYNSSVDFWAN